MYNEIKPSIKHSYTLILPLRVFLFILFNNFLGLFPYIFTASRTLILSLTLSLPYWVSLIINGWLNNTRNLLIHLIPRGTPPILIPFLVIIETIRNLIRPLTLAVRLTANIIAGHLLIVLLSSSFSVLPLLSYPLLILSQIALTSLEAAVRIIQAYVFSILITLYTAESIR